MTAQPTRRYDALAMIRRQIREVKRFPDGRQVEFDCQLLYEDRRLRVLRYVSDRLYRVVEVELPPGTVTVGLYWRWRHYLLWQMSSPEGKLLAHCFDICAGVRFEPDWVQWKDLFLDLWAPAGGEARFLDENEVAANWGLLSASEQAIVPRTKAFLERNWRRIIAEAEAFLRTLESGHDPD